MNDLFATRPGHPLVPERDDRTFRQLVANVEPLFQHATLCPVREFVAPTYEAVAIVLHRFTDDAGQLATWKTVGEELGAPTPSAVAELVGDAYNVGRFSIDEGAPDSVTMRALVSVLRDATATPNDVYFARWEGWGGDDWSLYPDAADVPVPARPCRLFRGPIMGVLVSLDQRFPRENFGPLLWCPADGAWMVATDVDHRWTFVAGTDDLISRLLAHSELEAMRTTFDAPARP